MGPAIIAASSVQVNVMVNGWFASWLEDGTAYRLGVAFRLMQLPLGLFGVAIGTVTLPLISRMAATGNRAEFRRGARPRHAPGVSAHDALDGRADAARAADHQPALRARQLQRARHRPGGARAAGLRARPVRLLRAEDSLARLLRDRSPPHADDGQLPLDRAELRPELVARLQARAGASAASASPRAAWRRSISPCSTC